MKHTIISNRSRQHLRRQNRQSGAALIMTLIVLLVLTVVAVGVTNSNQSQSIMVRNSQFRLESFNVSFAEIDAQIDNLNRRKLSDGVPVWMIKLIDGDVGERVASGAAVTTDQISFETSVPNDFLVRDVAQEFRGTCLVFGQQAGVGVEKVRCNEVVIESDANLKNTSVASNQRQVYEYKTLN